MNDPAWWQVALISAATALTMEFICHPREWCQIVREWLNHG